MKPVPCLLLTAFLGGVAMSAENLARHEGVFAVADSENRNRWGLDGYHAEFVCRLITAAEAAFVLAESAAISEFQAGEEYAVLDVGKGDRVLVLSQGTTR